MMASARPRYLLIQGDARHLPLADGSVQCCVCSPPYWRLRDYGIPGQLGMEPTPELYVAAMVEAFREVRRVLRDDGTLWLDIGDSYSDIGRNHEKRRKDSSGVERPKSVKNCERCGERFEGGIGRRFCSSFCGGLDNSRRSKRPGGLKAKDLVGIPWMLAFALRADGWFFRSDIIWHKPNVMSESVRDRPTKSHEYVFLLTKSARYFYDNIAVSEEAVSKHPSGNGYKRPEQLSRDGRGSDKPWDNVGGRRNGRTLWSINTSPLKAAHFATMPVKLAARCIRAGTSQAGCCPICKKPWRRIVERNRVATRPGNDSKVYETAPVHPDSPLRSHSGDICGNRDPQRHVTETRTVGWEPGCKCPVADPVPCIVFDPFGGAGTTVVAAEALGRVGIATELSAKYLTIARRRIERPHARVARPARAGAPMPLLDGLDDES